MTDEQVRPEVAKALEIFLTPGLTVETASEVLRSLAAADAADGIRSPHRNFPDRTEPCPACGSRNRNLPGWTIWIDDITRNYKCASCGHEYSVKRWKDLRGYDADPEGCEWHKPIPD